MRVLLIILLLGPLGASDLCAQSVKGMILGLNAEGREERLPGAQLIWAGTGIGAITDSDGIFSISPPEGFPATLVISFVGYQSDSIDYSAPSDERLRVVLREGKALGTVEVKEKRNSTLLDTRSLINVEGLGAKELKRAACCDLSESFESSATVDVSFSDAITGTKAIKMLGLDGKYAQLSLENIPFFRGFSATTGMTFIPGTWLGSINITKGVGPIGTGPNSMTGQVELRLIDVDDQPPAYVNLYGNTQGRTEANVHIANSVGKKWKSLLLLHGNLRQTEIDGNNDGFLDAPISERVNVLNTWHFSDGNREARFGLRVVDDRRRGGQTGILRGETSGSTEKFRTDLNDRLFDFWAKHGWIFENDPTKSIGLIFNARRHEVGNTIGRNNYSGTEHAVYGNAIFQMLLGDGSDQLKAGITALVDDFEEQYNDSLFSRTEYAPGAFAEYTFKQANWALVGGIRADHHEPFGTQVSPRIHFKYDFHPLTVLRLSAGKAYRSANPFVEALSYQASSRAVITEGPIDLEESWNVSMSFLHKWKWFDRKFAINLDLIRTEFMSQMVVDVEDPDRLRFYMLKGESYANSLQADLQIELNRFFDLKLAYRYYDARTGFESGVKENPFTPRHRGLIDLAYEDLAEKWRFDASYNLFGSTRIPDTQGVFDGRSEPYGKLNAQITRLLGDLELYFGAENLLNFVQKDQIIGIDDPFGADFDAAMIWGPVMGRNVYGGLRYTIPGKDSTNKTEIAK
jgi:hypothetical protein